MKNFIQILNRSLELERSVMWIGVLSIVIYQEGITKTSAKYSYIHKRCSIYYQRAPYYPVHEGVYVKYFLAI